MAQEEGPQIMLQHFIDAINSAIGQKNWYAALALALALPDICGWLEIPKIGSEKRFVVWWDKYLLSKYTHAVGANRKEHVFLSGQDVYALRCSYLHQGSDDTIDQRAHNALTKFHFVIPPQHGIIHCNQTNKVLQLQIDIFCRDICNGVDRWTKDNEKNTEIIARTKDLLSIHDSSKSWPSLT